MKTLRIFVSSPGDVGSERVLAGRVLKQLEGEFRRRVRLESYFWEYEPMSGTTDFQGSIPPTSEFDILICILWSRLGSRLNEQYRKQDGSPYGSGTEYELDSAEQAYKLTGKPELLIYRNLQKASVPMEPEEERNEKIRQFKALQVFMNRWFLNADGTVRIATNDYRGLDEFEEKLRSNLHSRIESLAPAPTGPEVFGRQGSYMRGSPFRKLRPFEFEDSEIFFGRTKATDEILEALRANAASGTAFALVFGGSGSGKSSITRAGVLPLLVSPGIIEGVALWRRAVMRPGKSAGDIFLALATALVSKTALPQLASDAGVSINDLAETIEQSPGGLPLLIRNSLLRAGREIQIRDSLPKPPTSRLVILVDQFEEIFTVTTEFSAEKRAKFIHALAELARSGVVWILTTLRSEFFARCGDIPELVELKSGGGQVQLLPPSASELRQIVRLPAIAAGLQFETDENGKWLADVLVDAGGRQPGSLPLLEFALEELYLRRRDDEWLTYGAFKELRGIEGALESVGETTFLNLDAGARAEFDPVFQALVTVDLNDQTAFVRRVAELDRLATSEERKRIIAAFVEANLLVTGSDAAGHPIVEVAHEALFLHWDRLKTILDGNREFLQQRARAGAALALWNPQKTETSYLWTHGKLLTEAEDLLKRADDLTPAEAEFAKASVTAGKSLRRKRRILAALGGLAAMTAGVAGYFLWQSSQREAEITGLRKHLAAIMSEPTPSPYEIVQICTRLLKLKPDDSLTWTVYAAALLNQKDYEGFDDALKRWQTHVSPVPPKILDLRGDREAKQGRTSEAINYWSQYLADRSLSREEKKQTLRKLAAAHAASGQWTEARDRLTDWITLEDTVEARVLRAKASRALRDWEATRLDVDVAVNRDPSNPDVKNFGPVMGASATDDLDERIRKSPGDPAGWLARALSLTRELQFPAALEDIERARNLNPDSVRLWIEEAHLHWQLTQIPKESGIRVSNSWKRGNDPQFLAAFEIMRREMDTLGKLDAVCAEQSDKALPYLERAKFLRHLGQPELAIRDLTRALEIDDHLVEALKGRAEAYREAGQPDAAEDDFRRIKELSPNSTPTR